MKGGCNLTFHDRLSGSCDIGVKRSKVRWQDLGSPLARLVIGFNEDVLEELI